MSAEGGRVVIQGHECLRPLSYLKSTMEDDLEFPADALKELERIQARLKVKSTYTVASAVSGLLNHWLVNRELKCYERGRAVEDVTAAVVYDLERGLDAIEDAWQIDIVELMTLLESRGMKLPSALCAEASKTPEDDLPNEYGYTIRGAGTALEKKYSLPEGSMTKRIFEAAEQGILTVRDPQTGLPYIPKLRRDFWERISVEDLDAWLEASGVDYRLGDLDASCKREKGSIWTEEQLAQLCEEAKTATHDELGKKYGLSRQRVGALLNENGKQRPKDNLISTTYPQSAKTPRQAGKKK